GEAVGLGALGRPEHAAGPYPGKELRGGFCSHERLRGETTAPLYQPPSPAVQRIRSRRTLGGVLGRVALSSPRAGQVSLASGAGSPDNKRSGLFALDGRGSW